jgi:hypothetical protein
VFSQVIRDHLRRILGEKRFKNSKLQLQWGAANPVAFSGGGLQMHGLPRWAAIRLQAMG